LTQARKGWVGRKKILILFYLDFFNSWSVLSSKLEKNKLHVELANIYFELRPFWRVGRGGETFNTWIIYAFINKIIANGADLHFIWARILPLVQCSQTCPGFISLDGFFVHNNTNVMLMITRYRCRAVCKLVYKPEARVE